MDGERVYALSRQGILTCLSTAKGEILWQKDFKKDFGGRMMSGWDYSESPLVDGDKLVCTPGGDTAALIALDKKTGDVIWKAPISEHRRVAATLPSSSPRSAAFASTSPCWAPAGPGRRQCGQRQVSVELRQGGQRHGPHPDGHRQGRPRFHLHRLQRQEEGGAALLQLVPEEDGIKVNEVYTFPQKTLQNHHGGMVLIGDYIFGGHGHNNGQPFCLEMKTGKFAWAPVPGAGSGSAAVVYADGHLYFRYQDNMMALIEATPEAYKLKSQFRLPEGTSSPGWQHPVIVHGRMYIRGNGELLCYDIRQK